MTRVEVYIISKEEGTMLYKYSILGMDDEERDDLTSGFLTALNIFYKELNKEMQVTPSVSLLRTGSFEARFYTGDFILTVLIINHQKPFELENAPILGRMAIEITNHFEQKYKTSLKLSSKSHLYNTDEFLKFRNDIDDIINKLGDETFEMYQNLVLIESIYMKVPSRICLPLMERVSARQNIVDEFPNLIKKYPQMERAIEKVNYQNQVIWEIFAIPIYHL